MNDPISWLFDTSLFMTRANCGQWSRELVFVYQSSNLMIAAAYFSIPAMLITLWLKRRTVLPKSWILVLFGTFIFLCGCTHVLDFLVFYWAPYRFISLVSMATAVSSLGTAIVLPKVIAHFMNLMTPIEYEQIIHELNVADAEKQLLRAEIVRKNEALESEVARLKDWLNQKEWSNARQRDIAELQIKLGGLGGLPSV